MVLIRAAASVVVPPQISAFIPAVLSTAVQCLVTVCLALFTKNHMPSPQIHTFLTHLVILRALSGSENLHIIGQPSVNAQVLPLENSLDSVGMDVSSCGCVS